MDRLGCGGGIGEAVTAKINATKTMIDGYLFDSQSEARRYLVLKSRWQAGEITQPVVHPQFFLAGEAISHADGKRRKLPAITFHPDFAYREGDTQVIEDVKPHKENKKSGKRVPYTTEAFRLRWNILQRYYPDFSFRIVEA